MASALRWASREISARRRAARSDDTRWPIRKAKTSSSTTCISSAEAATYSWADTAAKNRGMASTVSQPEVNSAPARP